MKTEIRPDAIEHDGHRLDTITIGARAFWFADALGAAMGLPDDGAGFARKVAGEYRRHLGGTRHLRLVDEKLHTKLADLWMQVGVRCVDEPLLSLDGLRALDHALPDLDASGLIATLTEASGARTAA